MRLERTDRVLTGIHSRPEVRNAVDPEHAEALHHAFVEFDADDATDRSDPTLRARSLAPGRARQEGERSAGEAIGRARSALLPNELT